MRTRSALLLALPLALLVGCPSAEIVDTSVPEPDDAVLVVHSRTSGFAHVPERCRVEAAFGEWRGVGATPMARGVSEPQDVYSEVTRWERRRSYVPEGEMRVRFFYQDQLMAERYFDAPDLDPVALERQLFWSDPGELSEVEAAWPRADTVRPHAAYCPACGARFPADARFCTGCGRQRP